MAEGIIRRHSNSCAAKQGGRCRCEGGYQAWAYSPRDGRKIYKTFARESEAKSWRADAKSALDHGTLRAPSRTKLREAGDAWLDGAERGDIRNRSGRRYKPATLRGYRQALDDRVLPALGSHRLNAVTTADLQALVDRWQAEGQAASTTRNSIKPLQVIYRRAPSREGLALNPTHDLELPAPDPTEVEIVAPDVAARMLAALPAEDRTLWATALYAGLRYGELRALRWGSVDLAGGTIRVVESWDPKEGRLHPRHEPPNARHLSRGCFATTSLNTGSGQRIQPRVHWCSQVRTGVHSRRRLSTAAQILLGRSIRLIALLWSILVAWSREVMSIASRSSSRWARKDTHPKR